jgi:cytochrome oxidase Cu insertion factor (SCO1/SenC/PrrC family)
MANTIKWIILSIVSGIAAIFLYTTIDSEWASRTNMSIWMTILFFASATVAIVCVFNAVETNDKTQEEDKTEKPPVSREAPKAMDIKKIGRMTS